LPVIFTNSVLIYCCFRWWPSSHIIWYQIKLIILDRYRQHTHFLCMAMCVCESVSSVWFLSLTALNQLG